VLNDPCQVLQLTVVVALWLCEPEKNVFLEIVFVKDKINKIGLKKRLYLNPSCIKIIIQMFVVDLNNNILYSCASSHLECNPFWQVKPWCIAGPDVKDRCLVSRADWFVLIHLAFSRIKST